MRRTILCLKTTSGVWRNARLASIKRDLPASEAASLWRVGSQTIDWGSAANQAINCAQSIVCLVPAWRRKTKLSETLQRSWTWEVSWKAQFSVKLSLFRFLSTPDLEVGLPRSHKVDTPLFLLLWSREKDLLLSIHWVPSRDLDDKWDGAKMNKKKNRPFKRGIIQIKRFVYFSSRFGSWKRQRLTLEKQLLTLGSILLPPKAAISPNWRGIYRKEYRLLEIKNLQWKLRNGS